MEAGVDCCAYDECANRPHGARVLRLEPIRSCNCNFGTKQSHPARELGDITSNLRSSNNTSTKRIQPLVFDPMSDRQSPPHQASDNMRLSLADMIVLELESMEPYRDIVWLRHAHA